MSFKTLKDGFRGYLGESAGSDGATQVQFLLNLALQHISQEHAWDVLRRRSVIKLIKPRTDGQIKVVKDLDEIEAGASPPADAFDYSLVGAQFRPSDTTDQVYEVIDFLPGGTPKLVLDIPYQSTSADVDYTLVKSVYTFPMEMTHYHLGKIPEENQLVMGAHDLLPDFIHPDRQATGRPQMATVEGFTKFALETLDGDFLNGNTDITNASVTPVVEWVGRSILRPGDVRHYIIKSISGTTITLVEKYRGVTGTTQSFDVTPPNSPEIGLQFHPPDKDMLFRYIYSREHPWIIEDTEAILFPPRYYRMVYSCTQWHMALEEDLSSDTVAMYQRKYDSEKKRIIQRQSIINPKLSTPDARKVRSLNPNLPGVSSFQFPGGFGPVTGGSF